MWIHSFSAIHLGFSWFRSSYALWLSKYLFMWFFLLEEGKRKNEQNQNTKYEMICVKWLREVQVRINGKTTAKPTEICGFISGFFRTHRERSKKLFNNDSKPGDMKWKKAEITWLVMQLDHLHGIASHRAVVAVHKTINIKMN